MAMSFRRSLSSLEADGYRGVALGFLIAAALLAAWTSWFVLARVAVYEVTDRARLEVMQAVHPVDVRLAGRVVATHLELGRNVREGDVLVELDADEERLRVDEERTRQSTHTAQSRTIERELAAEQEALEAAQRTALAALAEARSQLAEAEPVARFAEDEAQRVARLRAGGLTAEVDELRARAEAQRRRAAADSVRLAVERLERSQQTEERDRRVRAERLQGELTRLRGQGATTASTIRRLEYEVERRVVRAPVSGRLGEVAELRVGAFVDEGQRLGAIVSSGELKVIAEFQPAAAFGRIRPAQPAVMRLAGFPWTEYGSVAAVVDNVASEVRSGAVRVELAIRRDRPSPIPLQHGLPGVVEVEVERVAPAALVLRAGGRLLMRPVSRGTTPAVAAGG